MAITKEQVIERLQHVMDPEIDSDVWGMGLIYEIDILENGGVHILYTLTSPLCPLGSQIESDIRAELIPLGLSHIELELTFEPAWQPPKDMRAAFGI